MFARGLAASLCLWSGTAGAAEGDLRLSAQSGYDSNVRRDYEQIGTVSDAELSLLGTAAVRLQGENARAYGSYDLGLRHFFQYLEEDTLAQAATLEAAYAATQVLSVGAETRDKDRRGGNRDYTDLVGDAFVDYAPDGSVGVRLKAGAHRFIYWDNFAYSFSAPEVGLTGRYRFNRRHGVFFSADIGLRTYNSLQQFDPGQSAPPPADARHDTAFNAAVGYSYKGPFSLSVSYNFFEQDSNSFGESMSRHRLVATAGFRLPWRLYLLIDAALQYTVYPDGIFLSPEILLAQDDENTDALSVKLVRPVSEHVDVEAHYGDYHNHLPQNGLAYWRQVVWVGVTWRL